MAQAIKRLSAGGNQYDLILDVTQASQSIPNNTSVVSWELWIRKNSGTGYSASDTKNWSVNIGGQTKSGTIAGYSFVGKTSLSLGTGSFTIAHDADGTKSISISGTFTDSGYTGIGSGTATNTMTLTTIARASSIGTITGNTIGSAVTVAISRAASSFTHTVVATFGTYSTTLTGQGTSATFTPPLTWANAIPNSATGTGNIAVTTYSGSTQIGSTVNKSFTLNAPSSMVPSFTSLTHEEHTNVIGAYIQNKNGAQLTINGAAGTYGSTIKSYSIVGNNQTINTQTASFNVFTVTGSVTFTGTVTDSRGRTASRSITLTVLPNSPATITSTFTEKSYGETFTIENNNTDSNYWYEIVYQNPANGTQSLGKYSQKVSWSLSLPASDASQLPRDNSGGGKLTLYTYYKKADESYFTIGSTTKSFTVKVPDSMQPTIGTLSWSETVTAVANVLPSGRYLQNLSRPRLTLETSGTTPSTGATISSIAMVGMGMDATGSSYANTFSSAVTFTDTQTYTVTVKDSRGRTASRTITLTPIAYNPPQIQLSDFKVERTDTAGNSLWDGTSSKTYWGVSVHTVKPSGTELNKLRVQIHALEQGESSYLSKFDTGATLLNVITHNSSAITQGYTTTKSYSMRLTVTDAFGQSAQAIILLPTAEVALDIGKDNIGVGKIRQQGTIDSAGQIYQNDGAEVPNGYVGVLPAGDINTGAYWRGLKNGMYFKYNTPAQTNQLSAYAHVWVIGTNNAHASEKTIIWKVKSDGDMYHSGTNGSTTEMIWRRITDSSNLAAAIFTKDGGEYDRVAGSTSWLRVPSSGLLPYSNGNSALGTSSWRFTGLHVNSANIYGNATVNGQITQNSGQIVAGLKQANGNYGLTTENGDDQEYIRTTQSGLLPYSTIANTGSSKVGTSESPFNQIHSRQFLGKGVSGNWLSGKEGKAMIINDIQGSTGSFHPVMEIKTPGGNSATIGHINEEFGIYGYKSDRTTNGVDYQFLTFNPSSGAIKILGQPLTDYIVESGYSYRKWNSGMMEQWGQVTDSGGITVATGSGFRRTTATYTFPIAFVGEPVITATSFNFTSVSINSATATVFAFNLTSLDSGRVAGKINWYAKGNWK